MEGKNIKYWFLTILLNYTPTILLHYIVRPMWLKGVDSHTAASVLELFFTMIFLPVYLLIINYTLAKKFSKLTEAFFLNCVMIISCISISAWLHLKNWTDSIGSINPDSETQGLIDFERFIGICVSVLGFIIIYFLIRKKNSGINKS